MTEEITAEQALKSKQKFMEYFENNTPEVITATLAKYQSKSGKIVVTICDLTQNIETLLDALSNQTVFNLPKMPYIVWIVTSPKEPVMNLLKFINDNSNNNGLGIFVFKAFLNGDKMDFECLLKPEYKEKCAKAMTKTGETQLDYWTAYSTVCDDMGYGDFQVIPAAQHYQNIPIGVKGAYIKQTISIKENYIATEIFIGNDKKLYEQLENHKDEIEKELGEMVWQNIESNKSCNIRKIVSKDLTQKKNLKNIATVHIQLAVTMKRIFSKYM